MSCRLFLAIGTLLCIAVTLQAASIPIITSSDKAVLKLDYDDIKANVWRSSRQAQDDTSGEDSDEDDDEDDAEQLQESIIRQQQAQEAAANASEESSDEDEEGDDDEEEDDDDDEDDEGGLPSFFGRRRRRRRDVDDDEKDEKETTNEIAEHHEAVENHESAESQLDVEKQPVPAPVVPAPTTKPNTSVLILIRDAIKKVTTELPNSQQVAASASQYFELFQYFLQQTIEQVIGDDDEEEEIETSTETEAEGAAPEEVEENFVPEAVDGDKESETESVAVENASVSPPNSSEKDENKPVENAAAAAAASEVPVEDKGPEKVETVES